MKKCPKCNRTYDDTWKVCLACESDLLGNSRDNNTESVLQNNREVKLRYSFGKISVFIVVLMMARLFMHLASNGEQTLTRKANEEFIQNIDKMSKAEILQYIQVRNNDVLNHPTDKEKRHLLNEAVEIGRPRLLKKLQSSESFSQDEFKNPIEQEQRNDIIDTIKATVGKEFTIAINANATTGYEWQLANPIDNNLAKFVNSEYLPDETGLVGSGGKSIWKFTAIQAGETQISFKYIRPWEKDIPPVRQAMYTVIIQKAEL